MNFHSCEKQIFKFFGYTKIRNNSKWTKTSQNEVMQQRFMASFSLRFHNQAGFDNPFNEVRGFIHLGISKMNFIF